MKYTFGLIFSCALISSPVLIASTTTPKGITMQQGETINLQDFTTTASGMKYKIINPGKPNGDTPVIGEKVDAHYTGWLLDGNTVGTKFDSSKDRGQAFQVTAGIGQVIKGWDEALTMMTVGQSMLIVLPPNLAYGPHGAGSIIPPNATLLFEIELLDIID